MTPFCFYRIEAAFYSIVRQEGNISGKSIVTYHYFHKSVRFRYRYDTVPVPAVYYIPAHRYDTGAVPDVYRSTTVQSLHKFSAHTINYLVLYHRCRKSLFRPPIVNKKILKKYSKKKMSNKLCYKTS
jgi:hypothetical protein